MNSTLRPPRRRRRYKCDCCLYKIETRRFVSSCVNHSFKAEDVQSLCTYLKVPIEKPGEWTLLSPNQTYMRPSVLWALDKLGIIEDFCQRPHRLKEILIEVLQREDLAKTHQELLDKFHTVKKCLQHFQSTDDSPVSLNEPERIPIQESATPDTDHQDKEQHGDRQQVERVPIAETSTPQHDISADLEADRELAPTTDHGQYLLETVLPQSQVERVRRDSEWSTHSRRVSSGFHERVSISSGTSGSRTTSGASTLSYRTDSGISVASSRKNTDDSLASATAALTLPLQVSSMESIHDGFCNSCRDWIDTLSSMTSASSTRSPSPPVVPVHNKSRYSSSYSSSDDGSFGLESSIPTTSRVEKVVRISGKMNVKRKKLIKNLKSPKSTWLHKSSLFPDAANLQGSHGQHKMRLYAHAHTHNSSSATAATLSLDLHPHSHGRPVQFSQLTVMVSIYATNDPELATTGHNIIAKSTSKVIVDLEWASIREVSEIAQFPELIPLDLLKRIEEKYIVTEVSILYM